MKPICTFIISNQFFYTFARSKSFMLWQGWRIPAVCFLNLHFVQICSSIPMYVFKMFKMFAQFVPSDVCNVFKLLLIICIGVRPVAEYKAGAGDRLPSSLPPTPFHTLEHTNIRAHLTISVYHAVPHNVPTSLPATQVTTSETPSLARSPSSSGQVSDQYTNTR